MAGLEPVTIRQEFITGKEIARNIAQQTAVGKQLIETNFENGADDSKYSYMEMIFRNHFQLFDNIMPIVKNCNTRLNVQIRCSLDGLVTSKTNLPNIQMKQLVLFAINNTYKGRGIIYTDASRKGCKCGVGIFVASTGKRFYFHLTNETSITGAELIAIKAALDVVHHEQLAEHVIFTDSKSACEILKDAMEQSSREEIFDQILELAARWKVSLQWIPSHVGEKGNELADSLAKLGLDERNSEKLENLISYKDAYWILKKWKLYHTNRWYQEYAVDKGRTFFQIQSEFLEKPWFVGLDLNGQQVRLLNRLMAGHDWSKFWLAKMKIADNPNCDQCGVIETADHLILHCTKYCTVRNRYSFAKEYTKLEDVLKSKNLMLYKQICNFAKEVKLDI